MRITDGALFMQSKVQNSSSHIAMLRKIQPHLKGFLRLDVRFTQRISLAVQRRNTASIILDRYYYIRLKLTCPVLNPYITIPKLNRFCSYLSQKLKKLPNYCTFLEFFSTFYASKLLSKRIKLLFTRLLNFIFVPKTIVSNLYLPWNAYLLPSRFTTLGS